MMHKKHQQPRNCQHIACNHDTCSCAACLNSTACGCCCNPACQTSNIHTTTDGIASTQQLAPGKHITPNFTRHCPHNQKTLIFECFEPKGSRAMSCSASFFQPVRPPAIQLQMRIHARQLATTAKHAANSEHKTRAAQPTGRTAGHSCTMKHAHVPMQSTCACNSSAPAS